MLFIPSGAVVSFYVSEHIGPLYFVLNAFFTSIDSFNVICLAVTKNHRQFFQGKKELFRIAFFTVRRSLLAKGLNLPNLKCFKSSHTIILIQESAYTCWLMISKLFFSAIFVSKFFFFVYLVSCSIFASFSKFLQLLFFQYLQIWLPLSTLEKYLPNWFDQWTSFSIIFSIFYQKVFGVPFINYLG